MEITRIQAEGAPKPIGPYSQAMVVDGLIYTAGQVGADPHTGKLVGEDVASQTARALENLQAVLQAAGGSLQTVLKTTVFLADLNDFAAMNEVYARYFGDHKPARSTVQVARLPLDAKVEIEAVARVR
jgi:2-iminobutanoate/2-iminopropanoate deaminase